ncbi:MAG: hypothetical protein NC123_14025 [Butyrivibrio sp.]|nr:hypothetical protein [Acetatifactor muris]MCM1560640.1 hypothetical protein [Butyrivibrio sp.]
MKKFFCFLLLSLLMLGGCGNSSLLKEIPRDFSVTGPGIAGKRETTGEEQGREGGAASSGAGEAGQEKDAEEAKGKTEEETVQEDPESAETQDGFLYEGAFEYAARQLSGEELTWYRDMKETLGNFGENVRLDNAALAAGCDEEDIDRIFQCVLNDHPELFYVEGYSYTRYTRGDRITSIVFSGTYCIDRETAESRREEIEAAAAEILAGVEEDADQYTKVKYVYDTIIRQTDYDPSSPDNQNIYSVFVNHRSVCQGYAKATQYLLNRLGVECTLVLGTVETGQGRDNSALQDDPAGWEESGSQGDFVLQENSAPQAGAGSREGHAWNLVRIDGEYYYVDTTWGDASYSRQDGEPAEDINMPEINYDYLNVTTEELLKSHTLGENIVMPQCVATDANYYLKEGALFTSYDREQLQQLFDRARAEDRDDITIKCADRECYNQVLTELVDNHEIFRYLEAADAAVAYARNDSQMSLTFWVTNE